MGAFGAAGFFGSTGPTSFNQPLAGITGTPSSHGYWEAAVDGAVFAFGDARFFGSTGGIPLNQPIVGMAATRTGDGYWLVAADGGVFTFGDARFLGSMGASHLNQPVVGIATTPAGQGYWVAAADGGVFTFGDARFWGSAGFETRFDDPVVGIAATPDTVYNQGYWIVSSEGRRFSFGRAFPVGDKGGTNISRPIVGIAPTRSSDGYWLIGRGTRGTLPGPVSFVRAGHGGGSGELAVTWSGVPGATGYRVLRSTAPTGPFSVAADINLTTGVVTHIADAINVFPFTAGGFQYIEVVTRPGDQRVYFHVTAYNSAGTGPPSVLVCGTVIGYPDC